MEMAEIVVALVKPAIEELGKVIVAPIKRQFNYLCCFTSNIQSLRKEVERLDNARAGLQLRVDAAKDNVEMILPDVESWLKSSDEIKVDINGIETEIPIVKRRFWNIKSRFLLSRKAKKTTEATKKLRGECNFNLISQPAPPPATGPIQIGETYEFVTRKKIEEDIMKALRGGEVNMLGICGMGGVGLELKEEALQARAHKLRARLTGTKKILVVLDDVWEIPKLEELGIPSGVKECTILLTSRNRGVYNAMDVKHIFGLEILPEEEAWVFFREKVGTCVDGQDLFL
ncbi:hypothetical protein BUALT_BualtUnG0058900 [Buddleja alternifolia]|uniref:NB-ARC domain-containing protein n=1 Tax=Buddleja alternifolia TaxID=168488 RepID=A0AAV6VYU5_9LAMI|nr:hypothetical protein BUALT_BualtUnG0058900 [Buddleja alternifolia]